MSDADPTVHDQALPEIQRAHLSIEQAHEILRTILQADPDATIQHRSDHSPRALRETDLCSSAYTEGFQIRYSFENQHWIDTLTPGPGTDLDLVRICHEP